METKACRWCGEKHGVRCPSVKAIEYHSNGKVRRVEFMTGADYGPTLPITWPPIPTTAPPITWGPSYSVGSCIGDAL